MLLYKYTLTRQFIRQHKYSLYNNPAFFEVKAFSFY